MLALETNVVSNIIVQDESDDEDDTSWWENK